MQERQCRGRQAGAVHSRQQQAGRQGEGRKGVVEEGGRNPTSPMPHVQPVPNWGGGKQGRWQGVQAEPKGRVGVVAGRQERGGGAGNAGGKNQSERMNGGRGQVCSVRYRFPARHVTTPENVPSTVPSTFFHSGKGNSMSSNVNAQMCRGKGEGGEGGFRWFYRFPSSIDFHLSICHYLSCLSTPVGEGFPSSRVGKGGWTDPDLSVHPSVPSGSINIINMVVNRNCLSFLFLILHPTQILCLICIIFNIIMSNPVPTVGK